MSEETLLTTRRFIVNRIERTLSDGNKISREVIRHPGSVVILPLLDDGRICMIRNFRVAAGKTLVELPAGTLEPSEPPAECASRELIEETGYTAKRVELITSFYAAPGIMDELMHLYAAHELQDGTPAREVGEEIENLIVTWQEALAMIYDGTICDAKTMIGLLAYHHRTAQ